jgi:glycosyltransferase involved in cell wall biosynthesis
MSLQDIHPVLITRDAAATIERTLESLSAFGEVVVYDNGSTDETLKLCARHANVKVATGPFLGFGPSKNHAASLANGDWILSIDADEYVGDDLLETLRRLDLGDGHIAYAVERHNLFMGKHVRRGGWGNDWLVRIYHRGYCRFDDARVHEKVSVPAGVRVARVSGALWHQAVTDIDQFLHKISFYSELRRGPAARRHSPLVTFLRAGWAFFRSYVLQLGFLEGWRGLVIANCAAQGTFFKHMKRYVDGLGG